MQFYPYTLIKQLLRGGQEYIRTPKIPQATRLEIGKPEFLDPNSWKPYDIYLTTPQLYAVIQRRGYLLASGKWKHYKVTGDKVEDISEGSEAIKLLNHPNPLMKGNDLIRQWNENKCVFGNNYEYLLKAFSMQEIPSGLTNLPPTDMKVKFSGKYYKQSKIDEIILGYKLIQNGEVKDEFETNEINYTRIVNGTNAIVGESPLVPLYMPISNIRAAYGFRNVIMNKRGALGILANNNNDSQGGIPITPDERKRLEREYQEAYGIADDQMQIMITQSSLNWQPMSYPTKDLMLFEEVDADFRTIIDNFGLNDNLFSREKGSTFTNLAEGMKQAYQETIIPEAEELALNRTELFGLHEKGEFLTLDYSHIPVLQTNKKEEAEILEKKANAIIKIQESGLMNNDEIRALFDLG